MPAPLRDPVYGFVSKRRKRWFGAADQCRLWDDNWETRFVSDDRLGLAAPTDAPDARDYPTPSFATGDAVVVASTDPVPLDGGALLANGLRGVVGDVAGATATVVLDVDGAEVTADVAAADLRAA